MITQRRGHAGHDHHHHHHHHHHDDNSYLSSFDKEDAGVRVTRIGLLVNLTIAFCKLIGGFNFHSQTLIADGYHALTDLVSDSMTLGTLSWSRKLPNKRFPNGYGKVESLGALGVSSLLLVGGASMGLNAGQALLLQFAPGLFIALGSTGLLFRDHSHVHDHGSEVLRTNINAAWLAAGSIFAKEWLYMTTMKIANERDSSVLASNAVHHRIDSFTSIVTLVTIVGAHIGSSYMAWLDPVGGLLISMTIVNAGWTNTKMALLQLADTTVGEEVIESIRNTASSTLAQSPELQDVQIRDIQGVKSGQYYLIDVEVAVAGSTTVEHSRKIEQLLRARIGAQVHALRRIKIRTVPQEMEYVGFTDEFVPGDVPVGTDYLKSAGLGENQGGARASTTQRYVSAELNCISDDKSQ